MHRETYFIGKRVWLKLVITDREGTAYDLESPDDMAVTFEGSAESVLTWSGGDLEHAGVGIYYAGYVPTGSGLHQWRAETTGENVVAAEQGSFLVEKRNV